MSQGEKSVYTCRLMPPAWLNQIKPWSFKCSGLLGCASERYLVPEWPIVVNPGWLTTQTINLSVKFKNRDVTLKNVLICSSIMNVSVGLSTPSQFIAILSCSRMLTLHRSLVSPPRIAAIEGLCDGGLLIVDVNMKPACFLRYRFPRARVTNLTNS